MTKDLALSQEQLRRAAISGKCHPLMRAQLRVLVEAARPEVFEAVAEHLGTTHGVVRANLKRASGLLKIEPAYQARD